ncbi:type VI secretion system tip protein VgrG [Marinobacterium sp. YM272]|uniref:type VI secretion system tip protein VgrG n=1 Tax=Marinobacterium sp. YM272 TaxID=3421654 RepID=UPI003D7F3B27
MCPLDAISSADLTTYSIVCDGVELPQQYQLEYIDIRRAINRIASAELAFVDGNAGDQDFALSSGDALKPGAEVAIQLGYANRNEAVFKGVIVSQQIKVTRSGQSRLIIGCRDRAFVLAQGEQSAHFAGQSDSDVIAQLASKAGLGADIANTSVNWTDLVQLRQSDWDFIIQRAELNGLLVNTLDGELIAQPVPQAMPAGTLSYGVNVIDLDLEIDARSQFSNTEAMGWSAVEQANTTQAGSSSVATSGNLSPAQLAGSAGDKTRQLRADGDLDANLLQNWANACVDRQHLGQIQGTVTLQGRASLKPGEWLQLEGFGSRFNGLVFVSGLLHAVSRGNWLTTLQIGLSPDWHRERLGQVAGPSGLGSHQGLHIGKVVALADDPDGEERIQVKLMTLGDEHQGVWARWLSMDAGNQRGAVFRPEIDDEVIVGFMDGDATQPVVLGAVHSSANPAPIEAEDDNPEKGWTTRSGMQVLFNDDEVSLRLETPAGNSILLSEDEEAVSIIDQHDNRWVMNSDGVSLSSSNKILIENSADIEIKGTNIKLDASANIEIKAGANNSVEGGAVTTVKGSLVQIN